MYPWRHIAIKWTAIVFVQNCTNCLIKATTWVLHLQPLIRDATRHKMPLHFFFWAEECIRLTTVSQFYLGGQKIKTNCEAFFVPRRLNLLTLPAALIVYFFYFYLFREAACHSMPCRVSRTQGTITNMISWLFSLHLHTNIRHHSSYWTASEQKEFISLSPISCCSNSWWIEISESADRICYCRIIAE